jgi:Na+-translocating ferredoxin:NAD+ oxidoreductase RNF subunit RnfB
LEIIQSNKNIKNNYSTRHLAEDAMTLCPLQELMTKSKPAIFVVDEDLCYGCGACIAICPTNALELVDRLAIVIQNDCTLCNHCIPSCPVFALSIKEI